MQLIWLYLLFRNILMRSFLLLSCLLIYLTGCTFFRANIASGNNYYVDAEKGSDLNDGLSAEKAWKSIDKVNSFVFQPGDSLLFKSGCQWKGQLRPKGSGTDGRPICISSYGKGELPRISQGEQSGIVVLLQDQEQWEIQNLEIDGGSAKPDEVVGGIHVQAVKSDKVLNHIVIRNCVVKNNLGSVKFYESCAIWVGIPFWNDSIGFKTSFNDVLIENNKVYCSDRNGILVWTTAGSGPNNQFMQGLIPSKNVVIRGNQLEDIGGDAILVLGSVGALVEKNVVRRCCLKTGNPIYGTDYNPSSAAIWLHHCENSIMQYNSVYDCDKQEKNNDGMAFDFDFNCNNNILQYNYSCNNEGGFLLIMNTATNNKVRYNISENDRGHVLFCVGNKSEMNTIYNNTFYLNSGSSYIVPNAWFINNIFMADKDASMSVQNPELGVFENNCYAGNWNVMPTDRYAVKANPLFVKPGMGSGSEESLKGYTLDTGSLCIGAGQVVEDNGGIDILGNNVRQGVKPTIGAIQ